MNQSLSVKYRPHKFEDVVSQESIVKILQRQLSLRDFSHNYLFCGKSGSGKTTIARILANEINNGVGLPIEIDAASNNGVENVRSIIEQAQERAIDGEYKIFIFDEVHMLSSSAWNALLKTIEEPPRYTIFIYCTTNPEKIPDTIINRVMRFNFNSISADKICERLKFICQSEGFTNYDDACEFISKICNGGMRDGISLLEKCSNYSTNLNIENVVDALGDYSYSTYFNLMNFIIDGDISKILETISDVGRQGNDFKLFVDKFLEFCLDITKYVVTKDIRITKIPNNMISDLNHVINVNDASNYYFYIVNRLLNLKNMLKGDTNASSTVEVSFINLARGM